jgi:hypothetical protein
MWQPPLLRIDKRRGEEMKLSKLIVMPHPMGVRATAADIDRWARHEYPEDKTAAFYVYTDIINDPKPVGMEMLLMYLIDRASYEAATDEQREAVLRRLASEGLEPLP